MIQIIDKFGRSSGVGSLYVTDKNGKLKSFGGTSSSSNGYFPQGWG